ncbi:hypothetical protein [Ferroplasma sp.]|uniref:hypothetical protein n=2 Tax=Ferroplasma sp. TaxID=2591003 RepID=UPI002605C18A|nr:hypothetical protein [Ferroplasma sp.]
MFEHDNDPKPLLMLSRYTPDYGLWDIISPSHHNYDAGQGLQSDEFSTYTYAICNGYTGNWKSFDTQYNEQINSPTFNGMLQIMYRYTSCSHLQLSYKISADGTMEGKFSDLCVVIKKAFINIPIGSYEGNPENFNLTINKVKNAANMTQKIIDSPVTQLLFTFTPKIKIGSYFDVMSLAYDYEKLFNGEIPASTLASHSVEKGFVYSMSFMYGSLAGLAASLAVYSYIKAANWLIDERNYMEIRMNQLSFWSPYFEP